MLRETRFYAEQKAILDMQRGAGYWLWTPFIVVETPPEMQAGDCLIYSDSGIEIVAMAKAGNGLSATAFST